MGLVRLRTPAMRSAASVAVRKESGMHDTGRAKASRRVIWQAALLFAVLTADGILAYALGARWGVGVLYAALGAAMAAGRLWLARRTRRLGAAPPEPAPQPAPDPAPRASRAL